MNRAPVRTRATRWGALTFRQPPLCRLQELEGHRQTRGPRAGPLRHPGSEAHGREGGLDGVAGAQVDVMLDREVVEGEQRVELARHLGGRLRVVGERVGEAGYRVEGAGSGGRRRRSRRGRPWPARGAASAGHLIRSP